MWSYYGSKSRLVEYYPKPKFNKIIEPFAGSARYALRYFDNEVLLVDKYEVVVKIWQWLQKCSEADIYKLPTLKKGEDLRTMNLSDEERLFLGMIAGVASISPRNKVSAFSAEQNGRKNKLKRIADQLHKIRHWEIRQACYSEIENQEATWFIDPPYQFGGHAYVHSKIDFEFLNAWSREREGQVIVCENTKADWMDFNPISKMRGANLQFTTEAMWTNGPSSYGQNQTELFQAAS